MTGPLKSALKIAGGIGLVLVGVVGLILPIMPGWVFLIPGLVILSEYFPPIRRLLDWARRKLEENDPGFFKGKQSSEMPSAKIEDRP